MAHSPEDDAALYLIGDMRSRARAAFERHLLDCEDCWREVALARMGRSVAEKAREVAPSELRDRIRATIAAHPTQALARRSWLAWTPTFIIGTATTAAIAIGLVAIPGHSGSGQPNVIKAALAEFRADRLAGTEMVHEAVPNLSALGLVSVGTGHGRLAGLAVNSFAYRDLSGHRIVVFTSDGQFPRAKTAASLSAYDGPWLAHDRAVAIVCARASHSMLILGADDTLLEEIGRSLGAM